MLRRFLGLLTSSGASRRTCDYRSAADHAAAALTKNNVLPGRFCGQLYEPALGGLKVANGFDPDLPGRVAFKNVVGW